MLPNNVEYQIKFFNQRNVSPILYLQTEWVWTELNFHFYYYYSFSYWYYKNKKERWTWNDQFFCKFYSFRLWIVQFLLLKWIQFQLYVRLLFFSSASSHAIGLFEFKNGNFIHLKNWNEPMAINKKTIEESFHSHTGSHLLNFLLFTSAFITYDYWYNVEIFNQLS